jgi:hypothetical protein
VPARQVCNPIGIVIQVETDDRARRCVGRHHDDRAVYTLGQRRSRYVEGPPAAPKP